MDKTYAEKEGKVAFDWNKVLKEALKEEPTQEEWHLMRDEASLWATCACGNQCAIIPRGEHGEPKDGHFNALGIWFMHEIENKEWRQAVKCLQAIELRAEFLINNELVKLQRKHA